MRTHSPEYHVAFSKDGGPNGFAVESDLDNSSGQVGITEALGKAQMF